ncbi:MAG: hypothetical protein NTZ77_03720 [Caldiserica bacterium]|nr:hypothetical protein [Caldisericota bacterium]
MTKTSVTFPGIGAMTSGSATLPTLCDDAEPLSGANRWTSPSTTT